MRRRNPQEDEIKFLLKASKKGKGGVEIGLAKRALALLGWRIDDEVVALPANRKEYESRKLFRESLAADLDDVSTIEYGFYRPQAWTFGAEKRAHADEIRGRFDRQFEILKAEPKDPQQGQWYATAPSDIEHDSRGRFAYQFFVKKIWIGVLGWKVTAANGQSTSIAGPLSTRHTGAYDLTAFWTFAYKNGLAEDAKRYLDTIGSQALAEATATKRERERIEMQRSALPEVAAVFREITDAQYRETIAYLEGAFGRSAQAVLQIEPNERVPWEKIAFAGSVQRLMTQIRVEDYNYHWILKPDYEQLAHIEAVRVADEAREAFVLKNTARISEIAKRKGSIPAAKVLEIGEGLGGYGGDVLFSFPDGSHFTLRNKTVWKQSSGGVVFAQFPTTFHDVVLPGGKKMSSPSEARMLDVFAAAGTASNPKPKSRAHALAERLIRGD